MSKFDDCSADNRSTGFVAIRREQSRFEMVPGQDALVEQRTDLVAIKDESMLLWRKHRQIDSGTFRSLNARSKRTTSTTRGSFWKAAGWTSLLLTAGFVTGCKTTEGEPDIKYLGQERDVQYYKDVSTKIEYPDVGQEQASTVSQATEPRRLRHPAKDQIWDMGLDEAVRTALQNSEVLRDSASFLSPGNRLLNNPDFSGSVYDIAIQETNILFGQSGPEAALAEFDAQFTTNMTWGRSEQVADSNTIGFGAFDTQVEEVGDLRTGLSKIFRSGDSFQLAHNVFYSGQNQSGGGARPFGTQYTSRPGRGQDAGLPMFLAEYRSPLLAGSGTEYTGIAGPIARRPTLASTPNVNQGVVIARIRTDISIAEFEEAVMTLVKDVEEAYWDLMLAYRTYDAEAMSRNSALQTWREVKANMEAGKVGAADEAQARDNFYEIRARAENGLASLYQNELRLRRLLGLSVNDGRVIRPSDDPITAEINPEWHTTLSEALVMRPELRKQKWNIKSLELQYEAAHSLIRPRLDFVARYEMNGFGDHLFRKSDNRNYHASAYESLFDGDQTGWNLGFEFSMPLGFRGAHSQVKNYEHRLGKARAVLANQELEVSHEVASSLQSLDQSYMTAKTNFNRRRAAERRLQAFEAEYKVGRTTLDQLLRSQISLAQAEIAYFQSLIGYNRALTEVKFRQGTILRESQVYLTESMWTPDAYAQAMRKAWARTYAFDRPNLATEPPEFVLDAENYELTAEPAKWSGYAEPLQPDSSNPTPSVPPAPAIEPNGDRSADASARFDDSSATGDGFVAPIEGSESRLIPGPPPEVDAFVPPLPSRSANSQDDETPPVLETTSSRYFPPMKRSGATQPKDAYAPVETMSRFASPVVRQPSPIQQAGSTSTTRDEGLENAAFETPVSTPRPSKPAAKRPAPTSPSRSQLLNGN